MWSTSRVSQRTIGDKWAYRDLIAVGSTGWPGTLAVLEEARTGHKVGEGVAKVITKHKVQRRIGLFVWPTPWQEAK
jgi:hypothetical protein